MSILADWWSWVFAPPYFLWRIPAVLICALFAWAIWMWLWDIGWPWARLVLHVLGKFFDRIARVLEWIPRKSKHTAAYAEHALGVCEEYTCEWHKAAVKR